MSPGILLIHLVVTIARFLGAGGLRPGRRIVARQAPAADSQSSEWARTRCGTAQIVLGLSLTVQGNTDLNRKKKIVARIAPAGMVVTQGTNMALTSRRSILSISLASPTPNTAPTGVWVVYIGIPVPDAMTIDAAAEDREFRRFKVLRISKRLTKHKQGTSSSNNPSGYPY